MFTLTRIIVSILVFFLLLAAAVYIYRWGTMLRTKGVPTISTFSRHYKLLKQLDIPVGSKLIDLGCGAGHALRWFAQHYNQLHLTGVDINRLAIRWGTWKNKQGGYDITLYHQDIFATDIADYDYIYLYLLPQVMPDIEKWLEKNAKPGTTIIANAFPLPTWTPKHVLKNKKGQALVFVYER